MQKARRPFHSLIGFMLFKSLSGDRATQSELIVDRLDVFLLPYGWDPGQSPVPFMHLSGRRHQELRSDPGQNSNTDHSIWRTQLKPLDHLLPPQL